jgi:arginase family enzyme
VEVKFFRAPLDPEEREHKLRLKAARCREGYLGIPFKDPYDGILSNLHGFPLKAFREVGGLEVEPWLLPAPEPKYIPLLTVENMVAFIDSDGCREYAEKVESFLRETILPGIPIMLGVDHSLTGGCVKALTREYDSVNLALIILDSHFDAIIPSVRCGLIQYDVETNPISPFSPSDPYVKGRLDSYNADSFIYYLVKERVLPPENILVLGVSDYPPPHAFKAEDSRVKRYLELYTGLESLGIKIVRKERLRNWEAVKEALNSLKAEYFYLSVDIDIGAKATLLGARFLDYEGLRKEEIYQLIGLVKGRIKGGKLAGLDLTETDIYEAGVERDGKKDETYKVEAEILRILLR